MRTLGMAVIAAITMAPALVSEAAASQCAPRKQISGLWHGSDGGKYWMRRLDGNVVWWVGESGDDGRTWTHVFRGKFDGNKTISGEWVDVRGWKDPKLGMGQLTLELVGRVDALNGFKKAASSGPFGATTWSFRCE